MSLDVRTTRTVTRPRVKARPSAARRRETIDGYLMIAPWLIGFVGLVIGPMVASLALSFTDWQLLAPPRWVGLHNYVVLLTSDPLIWKSLYNTAFYVIIGVPLHAIVGLLLSLAMNRRVRGMRFYRMIYFLPSMMPIVAVSLLWMLIFQPDFGFANYALRALHLPPQEWLLDPALAKPVLIVMYMWGVGGSIPIFLAGLQAIPKGMYEAAAIDGAGGWRMFRHITLPLVSPVLFFVLVTGFISGFQVFTQAYVATGGGPANSTMFYVLYLYQNAFKFLKMGYASSMAWLLFVIILAFTLVQFLAGRRYVYYEHTRD